MAQENIEISYPNFCLFPQAGTFGTIDTSGVTTRFIVKNTSGGIVSEYVLSANISPSNEVLAVEYVGPINLDGPIDDVTFFTLEKVSSSQCIIKRWELNTSFSLLSLKQQIVKTTSGNFYYDVTSMAVEHYRRTFTSSPGGGNQFNISNSSRLTTGQKLFLGPSTDPDNLGATETVTVDHVTGSTVYLTSTLTYQYLVGDPITFYNYLYLFSDIGYAGNTTQGTLFKLNSSTGTRVEYVTDGIYQDISGAKWSTMADAVAAINETQLLFIRPYTSYLIWKSMFLNNIKSDDATIFDVYDVVFDNYSLYKLASFATYRDDLGDKTTYSWATYNYQPDTLLPYTSSVKIFTDRAQMIGQLDETEIKIQVRDQFNVSLSNINVNLSIVGDPGAEFDPLNGQAITDVNGEAVIGYTSGSNYTGLSEIKVRADHSSVYTGSEYVWNMMRIKSDIDISADLGEPFTADASNRGYPGRGSGITQLDYLFSILYDWQIYNPYKTTHYKWDGSGSQETTVPRVYVPQWSFFTTPGGNWVEPGHFDPIKLPWLVTIPERTDGPSEPLESACNPVVGTLCDTIAYEPMPNRITLLNEFTQVNHDGGITDHKALRVKQPLEFLIYKDAPQYAKLEDGVAPYMKAFQKEFEYDLQLSQLKLSKHTHYVDGDPTDELWTYVNLDQFVFVEEADPAFWSEKNPRETDVWVRMRPFFFSLDRATLKFYIREVWTEDDRYYDTGYYELISLYGPLTDIEEYGGFRYCTESGTVCIRAFDAGGGSEGIEFLYQPPQIFHHNAIVYVHIEIYDEAPEPNYIYTDYWFKIIPDYNAPYLVNMDPDREQDQVPVDTDIYFEIKDDGAGVDMDTLEVFLNSRILVPTTITKVSNYHYKVLCELPYELQFGKTYVVGVKVSDISENKNYLRDSYRFYTASSAEPAFTGFDPVLCKRGMPRFTDVEFIVLGDGAGVDRGTIRLQVHNIDVTNKSRIIPIIYRIS